jgi:tRNA pseudouridine55 synthase
MAYFGLLNINKPPGWTSRDVVNRVARVVRPAKAGHAGTLDPLATGVLVVCVGQATRLIEYVQRSPKRYEATFLLGRRSDTDDVEGEVYELAHPPLPTREQLEAAIPRFLGMIEQRPPAFSALKVGGKRAYQLARAGQQPDLAPREVRIDELTIRKYDYPALEVKIRCGSGTYVRSLGRDLAAAVGTSAVMSQLCRTAVGRFTLADAIGLDELEAIGAERALLPAAYAVADLPRLVLDDAEIAAIGYGRPLARQDLQEEEEFAAFDASGRLIAVLRADAPGRLRPHRNFASSS